jgi:large exoprotein involved in heme utilization and adhesion
MAPAATRQFFKLPAVPSGSSGDVTINTSRLTIANGASVSALNQGSGNAGAVRINADSIFLDNQGAITAATISGEGGNIFLQVKNFILMRRNSSISATAGGTGNGGNITINSPFVIAVSSENSDIIANTFQGRGGNIDVTTYGIYGLQFRPFLTSRSDITASSDFGVNGNVTISTPGIDASQGLTSLPTKFSNVETVKDSCQANLGGNGNSFIFSGMGGLPPSPEETLSQDSLLVNWATLPPSRVPESVTLSQISPSNLPNSPLVEAQGWVVNSAGKIVLTAQVQTATPKHSGQDSATCEREF